MFALFSGHYDKVTQQQFDVDLAAKNEVLLLEDDAGCLQGFSTLQYWDEDLDGEALRILFSGDTIIDAAHWGSQALAFNWIRRAGQLQRAAPRRRLIWFLIVKGHRTYRYLPTFAIAFHPDWREPGDTELQRIADHLAQRKFGEEYSPERGVVHFPQPRGQLAGHLAEPAPRDALRPEVQFFLQRNPRYREGDELVCVCELSEDNLQPIARRVFRQGLAG